MTIGTSVRVLAPAKVNLCLSVGAVRADGYHEVDTVMHTLDLADQIQVTPADSLSLECVPSVGVSNERNTAWRAAVAFAAAFDIPPHFRIRVDKRIPHEAGLGGGSSDAAAVIAALALLNGIEPADSRCVSAAQCIGADVPFFLAGACAQLGGRGDELVAALPPLRVPVVLVRPEASVSTAAAYAAFDANPQPPVPLEPVVAALRSADPASLGASLANNLAVAAGSVAPSISPVLAWLADQPGTLGSLLAGSGSAIFAITDSDDAADRIAAQAASKGWWSCSTHLSEVGMRLVTENDDEASGAEGWLVG